MAAEYESRRVDERSAAQEDFVVPLRSGGHPASGHARQSVRGALKEVPRPRAATAGATVPIGTRRALSFAE